jgi:tripartite-type tricarboxylate transporter receptor subunit TctC
MLCNKRTFRSVVMGSTTAVFLASLAGIAPAADFYSGKTINFIIGGNPGGGYDTYARLVARHIDHYIPGHPTIVAQNMPGAGSGKAAGYIYSVAPKDGLAIGALYPGAIMGPLLDDRTQWHFKPTAFQYIGSADSGVRLCLTYETSKIKTFEDAQKQKVVMGASQAGGSTRDYAVLLNKLAGTKFDVVSGYKGSVDILLAMERGEVQGLCGFDWSSLLAQRPNWVRDHKINYLIQMGVETNPELNKMGIPEVWKYLKSDDDKKVVELVTSQQVFGRPYIAPPNTPADRVKILRTAFDAAMKDKALLAEADKTRLTLSPTSGDKAQALVEKLYATPKRIVEKAKSSTVPNS